MHGLNTYLQHHVMPCVRPPRVCRHWVGKGGVAQLVAAMIADGRLKQPVVIAMPNDGYVSVLVLAALATYI